MKYSRGYYAVSAGVCALAAVFVLLVIPGCGRENQGEEREGYTSAAERALLEGDFESAISCLEKNVILYPDDARAYLKLALIHEHLRIDKEKARQYYERYIAVEEDETLRLQAEEWLANLDSGKEAPVAAGPAVLVRQALELQRAEHRREIENLAAQHHREVSALQDKLDAAEEKAGGEASDGSSTGGTGSSEPTVDSLKRELEIVKQKVKDYESLVKKHEALAKALEQAEGRVRELEVQNTRLAESSDVHAELVKAQERIRNLERRLADATNGERETNGDETDATPATAGGRKGTRTDVTGITAIRGNTIYYEVQERDTLRVIAEKFYGDRGKWTAIFDENRDRIDNQNNIKIGDTLRIPILR